MEDAAGNDAEESSTATAMPMQEDGEIVGKRKASPEEEPRKRLRTDTAAEERRRGKRLFGSLLGTLGGIKKDASSAKAQERAAKQAEVDSRQQARLLRAAQEIADKQAETRALKLQKLKEKDAELEVQRIELTHAHQVLLAHNLATTAGPVLYYKPWKLTRDQEARIDEQLRIAKKAQADATTLLYPSRDVDMGQIAQTEAPESLQSQLEVDAVADRDLQSMPSEIQGNGESQVDATGLTQRSTGEEFAMEEQPVVNEAQSRNSESDQAMIHTSDLKTHEVLGTDAQHSTVSDRDTSILDARHVATNDAVERDAEQPSGIISDPEQNAQDNSHDGSQLMESSLQVPGHVSEPRIESPKTEEATDVPHAGQDVSYKEDASSEPAVLNAVLSSNQDVGQPILAADSGTMSAAPDESRDEVSHEPNLQVSEQVVIQNATHDGASNQA